MCSLVLYALHLAITVYEILLKLPSAQLMLAQVAVLENSLTIGRFPSAVYDCKADSEGPLSAARSDMVTKSDHTQNTFNLGQSLV